MMAIASMFRELLEHEGIPREEAHQHLRKRQLHYQDEFYRKLEDKNPSLAARTDTRPIYDFELPAEIARLFPK